LRKEQPPNKAPLLQILESKKEGESPQNEEEQTFETVGCTANVIYMDKDLKKIYVVNAGDSRCTMGKGGKTLEMSVDHKPESQIEIDRIEAAGSTITEGRVDGNLNLTRSLGDLKYKQRDNLTPEQQAITSNPDVYVFDYSDDIDFIIMGCDGIWEKKSNEEMVEYVYAKLKEGKENK
jgi:serine/threonine protein phosphatase PrpC